MTSWTPQQCKLEVEIYIYGISYPAMETNNRVVCDLNAYEPLYGSWIDKRGMYDLTSRAPPATYPTLFTNFVLPYTIYMSRDMVITFRQYQAATDTIVDMPSNFPSQLNLEYEIADLVVLAENSIGIPFTRTVTYQGPNSNPSLNGVFDLSFVVKFQAPLSPATPPVTSAYQVTGNTRVKMEIFKVADGYAYPLAYPMDTGQYNVYVTRSVVTLPGGTTVQNDILFPNQVTQMFTLDSLWDEIITSATLQFRLWENGAVKVNTLLPPVYSFAAIYADLKVRSMYSGGAAYPQLLVVYGDVSQFTFLMQVSLYEYVPPGPTPPGPVPPEPVPPGPVPPEPVPPGPVPPGPVPPGPDEEEDGEGLVTLEVIQRLTVEERIANLAHEQAMGILGKDKQEKIKALRMGMEKNQLIPENRQLFGTQTKQPVVQWDTDILDRNETVQDAPGYEFNSRRSHLTPSQNTTSSVQNQTDAYGQDQKQPKRPFSYDANSVPENQLNRPALYSTTQTTGYEPMAIDSDGQSASKQETPSFLQYIASKLNFGLPTARAATYDKQALLEYAKSLAKQYGIENPDDIWNMFRLMLDSEDREHADKWQQQWEVQFPKLLNNTFGNGTAALDSYYNGDLLTNLKFWYHAIDPQAPWTTMENREDYFEPINKGYDERTDAYDFWRWAPGYDPKSYFIAVPKGVDLKRERRDRHQDSVNFDPKFFENLAAAGLVPGRKTMEDLLAHVAAALNSAEYYDNYHPSLYSNDPKVFQEFSKQLLAKAQDPQLDVDQQKKALQIILRDPRFEPLGRIVSGDTRGVFQNIGKKLVSLGQNALTTKALGLALQYAGVPAPYLLSMLVNAGYQGLSSYELAGSLLGASDISQLSPAQQQALSQGLQQVRQGFIQVAPLVVAQAQNSWQHILTLAQQAQMPAQAQNLNAIYHNMAGHAMQIFQQSGIQQRLANNQISQAVLATALRHLGANNAVQFIQGLQHAGAGALGNFFQAMRGQGGIVQAARQLANNIAQVQPFAPFQFVPGFQIQRLGGALRSLGLTTAAAGFITTAYDLYNTDASTAVSNLHTPAQEALNLELNFLDRGKSFALTQPYNARRNEERKRNLEKAASKVIHAVAEAVKNTIQEPSGGSRRHRLYEVGDRRWSKELGPQKRRQRTFMDLLDELVDELNPKFSKEEREMAKKRMKYL